MSLKSRISHLPCILFLQPQMVTGGVYKVLQNKGTIIVGCPGRSPNHFSVVIWLSFCIQTAFDSPNSLALSSDSGGDAEAAASISLPQQLSVFTEERYGPKIVATDAGGTGQ